MLQECSQHYRARVWVSQSNRGGGRAQPDLHADVVLAQYRESGFVGRVITEVVFIDGNHTFDFVLQDMEEWYPKVKMGGIFSGHDYYPAGHHYHCVTQAVDKFCKDNGIKVLTAPDHVWWFKK